MIENLTNHPQIERIYKLFLDELQPFRKAHRMIDLFEVIIKTHTAIIIADYFRQGNISDAVKYLLAEGLRVPVLGNWQFFSRKLLKEMQTNGMQTFIPGFNEYFSEWDKEVAPVISLRNKYAHGATPDDEECLKDIEDFYPVLEKWLSAEWLSKTKIVSGGEKSIEIEGVEKAYLLDEAGNKLDLFPIITLRRIITKKGKEEIDYIFFNDLKGKKTTNYLHYPYALHIKDKEIYSEFQKVIKTEEWRKRLKEEFREKIEELTDIFKGRIEEKQNIKNWIEKNDKGFLFIFGKPGIGKSALIAQTLEELKRERKKQLNIIEYFVNRGGYANPGKLLKYLSGRLEEIEKTNIEIGITVDDKKEKFDERIRTISNKGVNKKIVIFIDGLDEGDETNLLQYLISETYSNIVVIYSSRETSEVRSFYNRLPVEYKREKTIEGLKTEDIRALLYEVTDKYALTKEQVSLVMEKSEGNPLYMKLLCLAIEKGEIDLEKKMKLPSTVEGFYKAFIERYSKMKDGGTILKSLDLFAVARDYLSQKQLEMILEIDEAESERVLMALQEVLVENEQEGVVRYKLFHESMREYLEKKKKEHLRKAEEQIVKYCKGWKNYENVTIRRYPLMHYAYHLRRLGKKDELFDLALNREYQDAQLEVTEQFDASFDLIGESLMAYEEEPYKLIEIGVEAARVHLKATNSLEEIERWIELGGIENYRKALKRILNYEEGDRAILFMILLRNALDSSGTTEEEIAEILEFIDENLTKDTSLLKLNEVLPLAYLVYIAAKIKEEKRGVIIERCGEIGKEDIENELAKKVDERMLYVLVEFAVKKITDFYSKSVTIPNIYIKLLEQTEISRVREHISKLKEQEIYKIIVLCALYETLINNKNKMEAIDIIKEAFEISLKLKDISDKIIAQSIIAKVLFAHGEKIKGGGILKKTLDLVKKEEFNLRRVIAMNLLFRVAHESKKEVIAKELLIKTIKIAEKIESKTNRDHALGLIAREAILFQELEYAIKIVEKIKQNYLKQQILVSIAGEFSKNGKIMRALRIIDVLKSDYNKIKVLIFISKKQYNRGNIVIAKKMIGRALKFAQKIKESKSKFEILILITEELVAQKNLPKAIELVDKISVDFFKYRGFASITGKLVEMGEVERANAIIESIKNKNGQVLSLIKISDVLFKQGEKKEAKKIFTKALKIAREIQAFTEKNYLLLELIEKLSSWFGAYWEAIEIAKKINKSANALRLIAWDALKYGDKKEAEEVLLEVLKGDIKLKNDSYDKSVVFRVIFEKFSAERKIWDAFNIALKVREGYIKTQMLSTVSQLFFNIGEKKYAKKIMDEAIEYAMINEFEDMIYLAFFNIALTLYEQKDIKNADKIMRRAIKALRNEKNIDMKIQTLTYFSKTLYYNNKKEKARGIILRAIEIADNSINIYNNAPFLTFHEENPRNEIIKALNIAQEVESGIYKILAYMDIYSTFNIMKDKINAEKIMRKAINEAECIIDDSKKVLALSIISQTLYANGDREEAKEIIFKANKIIRGIKINDNRARDSIDKAFFALAVGLLEQGMGKLAVKYASIIENEGIRADTLIEMASLLIKKGYVDIVLADNFLGKVYCEGKIIKMINTIYENADYEKLNEIESYGEKYFYEKKYILAMYLAIVRRIFEQYNEDLITRLPKYLPKLYLHKDGVGLILYGVALYLRFIKEKMEAEDKRLLKKLNQVIEISEFIDWEEDEYSYTTLEEWINDIEDEDDKEQIELWAKKVKKGKMTEEEFENNVKSLLRKV